MSATLFWTTIACFVVSFIAGWLASNLYRNWQEHKMWYGDRK